jgi:hypothetical protein
VVDQKNQFELLQKRQQLNAENVRIRYKRKKKIDLNYVSFDLAEDRDKNIIINHGKTS